MTSATGINLSKKLNDEAFKVDGSILSAPGIGLGLNLRMGCNFFLKNKFSISPFVGVGLDPFIWAPDAESLLNQTYDMATDPFTIIFRYQLGMAINFSNNSRDER
ncbi:MAG TPA: hypothetical protein EYQ86_08725 [Bacteroidetes bacterium]|nr:hypothetical protein [Bacteroidota bacterium]